MATTTPVSIQLATFPHSHSQSPDDLSPTSQKAFPLDVFPVSEPISAPPSYSRQSPAPRRWSWQLPDADKVETVLWAAVPLVFYAIAFALALGLLVSQAEGYTFLSVVEKNGSGRLDYYIMNACSTTPDSTKRVCDSRAVSASFAGALSRVGTYLPGFASLKLPFYSRQTPAIFLSALVLLIASFLVYLPLWTLAYFPTTRTIPAPVVRFYRYYCSKLFLLSALFAFASFILTITIGIGYKLYMLAYVDDFTDWYALAVYKTGSKTINWTAQVGKGFDLVWAASTFQALIVVALNISLHNGLDERVEWPESDLKTGF
ncbi:hypothetical protein RTBOTA2_000444 [Rhodotorula toruloides]|uniref:Uncharacterized protein n=1 Tax=Rhodotorula toruloides TaxID=5286 RepID=A0A0K3CJ46_RHOTO|nr:hypothetical protein RTBOTA2_000444 [Rhodotorula toruloides]PRQ72542.1 hypothetical protein AAT19DRAFT_16466 [Rhodotorula toruloides]